MARSVDGDELGFHPSMGGVKEMFDSGALAVIANVGMASPPQIGVDPEVAYIPGGFFTSRWAAKVSGMLGEGNLSSGAVTGFRGLSGGPSGLNFVGENASAEKKRIVAAAERNARFATAFPATSIGLQLLNVAKVLKSGVTGGIRQQVFFTVHAGYDTHTNQMARQALLFRELSEAMSAFHAATVELGISRTVTTFTDSPFGRALQANAAGGSEHGWGSHQLVVGGSVLGGKVYGELTTLNWSEADGMTAGTLRSNYTGTLALWNGSTRGAVRDALSDSDLAGIPFLT